MSKQWLLVGVIVAGLAVGAATLSRLGATIEVVEVGSRAPDFSAVDLASGDSVTLASRYAGSVTLVNIWATWCIPCRAEMPAIEQLYQRYGSKGFKVAAVSVDEGTAAPILAFARDLGLTFDILHDRTGVIQTLYQTTGVPESFLIDKDGRIVRKIIGEHPWGSPANQRIVAQLLGLAAEGTESDPPIASDREIQRTPGG